VKVVVGGKLFNKATEVLSVQGVPVLASDLLRVEDEVFRVPEDLAVSLSSHGGGVSSSL
jgi:hypothetical protein